MIDTTVALAHLARRAVLAKFGAGDTEGHVRVNCLERSEIVALVELLREWRPRPAQRVRVAVTARQPWPELNKEDIIPAGGESPTTLRNLKGTWVVLIEGEDYTDKQSWKDLLPISDRELLGDRESLCANDR